MNRVDFFGDVEKKEYSEIIKYRLENFDNKMLEEEIDWKEDYIKVAGREITRYRSIEEELNKKFPLDFFCYKTNANNRGHFAYELCFNSYDNYYIILIEEENVVKKDPKNYRFFYEIFTKKNETAFQNVLIKSIDNAEKIEKEFYRLLRELPQFRILKLV